MNARLLYAMVLGVICIGNIGWAEQPSSKSTSPFASIVPISFRGEGDQGIPSLLAQGNTVADDALPSTVNEPPPPDPENPDWGDYLSPVVTPIVPAPVQYNLVGPPRGVVQNIEGQEYQALIADADQMFDIDAHLGQTVDVFRPDGMGPVGLFGDHTLPAGTAFVSYRYLQNSFDQNYMGSHRIGVPTGYAFAPTRMLQDSQVAFVEYGVTRDLTMLAYLPFQHNEFNFQSATGSNVQSFTNPGDVHITGLLTVLRGDASQLHLNLGLSIPVGFLEQVTVLGGTPAAIPYQLQTSSGTYDLLLGGTYRIQTEYWTFGTQVNGVVPTGKNALGFELGNQLQVTGWASRRWTDRWSTSARLDGHIQGNIRGDDGRLDPALSPVNQANAQGRQYVNGLLGANYLLSRPGHRLREQRLFIEAGVPLYQWVDGPQVGLNWILNAGYGLTF